jgi:hypothetical protein
MGWDGNAERMTENKFIQRFDWKPQRKEASWRRIPRCRDNIKMDLGEIGLEGVD